MTTESNTNNNEIIIAVFGATGATGRHVVTYALEQGYQVQALARTPANVATKHDRLRVIEGDFEKEEALKEVIKGATYVICCAGGKPQPRTYQKGFMTAFVQRLWPLLEAESSVKVFLYQAGAFSCDETGKTPFMMKMMRHTVASMIGLGPMIADNDGAVNFMAANRKESFHFIVTRPGMLKEMESVGVPLEAHFTPHTSAISFKDLAAFSVEAVKNPALYGKCPFLAVPKQVHAKKTTPAAAEATTTTTTAIPDSPKKVEKEGEGEGEPVKEKVEKEGEGEGEPVKEQ